MKKIVILLLVIAVILGLAWFLFGGGQRTSMPGMPGEVNLGGDVVECPVMGTKMNKADAYSSTVYKGKTYYFCCAACVEPFKKNPEKYIK
jgi:YHS domain-containing protein